MYTLIRAALSRAVPSWTVWAGVTLSVVSGMPDVLGTVVGWFGEVTPENSARLVSLVMLATRLRSIVAPPLGELLNKN